MMLDDDAREQLLADCLRHIAEDELPESWPQSDAEFSKWAAEATTPRTNDKDAEAAWFDLYDLAMSDPESAWPILLELIARAPEPALSMLAAGPLGTFVSQHDSAFAERIRNELATNEKFREAYRWTRHADLEHSFTRRKG